MTQYMGGSPVSSSNNIFENAGVGAQAGADSDILPTLDVDGKISAAMSDLDAYGSSPVTSDAAAQRPLNPPTTLDRN